MKSQNPGTRIPLERKALMICYAGTVPLVIAFMNHAGRMLLGRPVYQLEDLTRALGGAGQWLLELLSASL
jgi:hypothetical protein